MRHKEFARTGVALPVVGQGTWNVPERGARRKEALRALRRAIALGMTHVDTAEMYGSGGAEELVGEAIAGIARASLFIASKVLPSNATARGTIAAAQRSIERMRCGYLDLYLLHWPGPHPLAETMAALERLVEQGTVRFVGVSNFDTDAMLEAASYLRRVPLACNQVLYHLNERGIEHRLVGACAERGIAVVAYTPFGRGAYLRGAAGRHVLESIAAKHAAGVAQIVLAFLTRECNVFAIAKAANTRHAEENAGAGAIELDAGDVAAIDAAFPRGQPRALATL